MSNKYIILFLIIGLSTSCKKDDIDIKKAEANSYLRYNWEPVIDSLNGQYFQGVDIGWNGQLYANYWKGWNGPGPTLRPATIISDDGINWQRVSGNSPIDGTWSYLKRHKETILAGTHDKGLFFSLDDGLSWTAFSNFDWKWPCDIRSNNEKIIISDFHKWKTFISEDDAVSWREIFPAYMRVIDLQANKILAMTRGRIIESNDWGNSWTYDTSLVLQEKEQLNSIGLGSINNQMIAATSKGIFKKNADGLTWTNIGQPLVSGGIGCMFIDKDKIIVQSSEGIFYFSNDLGQTWYEFGQGLPGGSAKKNQVFRIIKRDNYIYVTNSNGFFKRRFD